MIADEVAELSLVWVASLKAGSEPTSVSVSSLKAGSEPTKSFRLVSDLVL